MVVILPSGDRAEGYQVIVVALVNPGIDWAAYVGYEGWTIEEAAERGDKLPPEVARYFFPDITERYRR